MKILLTNQDWFLLGAFAILFLYFIIYFLTKRSEKYNLIFSIGCFLSILRILSMGSILGTDSSYVYALDEKIIHLHFIWSPFFYILLADSLFPAVKHKAFIRVFLAAISLLSLLIIFVSFRVFPYNLSYDYVILITTAYAAYIFTEALIKKHQFSLPLFIANVVLIGGMLHDVLKGSYVISSPFNELYAYTYLVFLLIASVVSAKKHTLIEKKHLESQIKFLNAQIQPHFLYNTINTIIACSRTDPEQSRHLLIELSTYLRGKFKGEKEMFTSLKDEIDLIKSYLTIEQVRFNDRLEVEYDIDEDLNILIPCLILQPIVENAVKHGLIPRKEGGKLEISVKKEDGCAVARIKDNGIGMDEHRLPEIMSGGNEGIGLSNTNERLKRYYGTQIKVKSEMDKGTEFTVTIPMGGGKKNDKMHSGRR